MKRYLAFLLAFTLEAAPLKLDVSARTAILMNPDNGAILYEKEPHALAFPASITKVATALYAIEKKGEALDEVAVANHDCITTISSHAKHASYGDHPPYRLESGGTHIGIRLGEALTLKVLLTGLLISSANDAANVIAHHISGDINRFVAELNSFLRSKGAKNTTFMNPSGLHHPHHVTTAYDMALITREALKHPFIRETVKIVRYQRPQTNKQGPSFLLQSNKLLRSGQYYYSKAIGVKTGYTTPAGYTLVAAAEKEGRVLIAVLLGCPDKGSRYRDAMKLFEAAFAEKPLSRVLFSSVYNHFTVDVPGAKKSLEAGLSEDFVLKYFPAEEPHLQAQISWKLLRLPIAEGEEVGRLELLNAEGGVYESKPIFAVRAVEKKWSRSAVDLCSRHRTALLVVFLVLNIGALLLYLLKKPKKIV